jgi:deoxyribodipyrimidine photolyase-related protein
VARRRRWLFGDQLGPHFLDAPDQPSLLIETRRVFERRPFHRQKAHLILSAMRHRAAELGDSCAYLRAGSYADALRQVDDPIDVVQPTSWSAMHFVDSLAEQRDVDRLPARGYLTSRPDFATWADARGGKRLLMEDFYRDARRRHEVLMDGAEPVTGRWNYDLENRASPPKGDQGIGVAEPEWPVEDAIDAEVRADLDRWQAEGVRMVGEDGPRRFAATRAEALAALEVFVAERLPSFGPYEDAVLSGDRWMAHSLLSAPMNLGLLDPLEVVRAAEDAYVEGHAPIASVEGFVRQVMGWRDYIWHLYWYLGEDYRDRNALGARADLPEWFWNLDPAGTQANCLSSTLRNLREDGWVHHIPRLMILGNYAMQQGWQPAQVTAWFHQSFVDGYDWVMVPNVVGMSQHADGGVLATKPYASGGNYLNTMTDYCGGCVFDPKVRVGENACPYTAGYWRFLHRHRDTFAQNFRMSRALKNLDRLKDLDELLAEG